ncbi:MAG TPA: hypothetical protein VNW46_18785, partial [Gemmatimonadaceae bacterium]|nr:hypothetical protein [Gemmatimonadaceae bacterium]
MHASGPANTRIRWWLLLVGGTTAYVVIFAILVFQEVSLTGLEFVPVNAALALAAWDASRRASDPDIRQSVRWLSVGAICCLVGNVGGFYVNRYHGDPLSSPWSNVPFIAWYPATLLALLRLPRSSGVERNERWKFTFDAAVAVLGGGLAVWYVVVPTLAGQAGTELFFNAIFPVGDIIVLVGLVTVLLRSPPGALRR